MSVWVFRSGSVQLRVRDVDPVTNAGSRIGATVAEDVARTVAEADAAVATETREAANTTARVKPGATVR